MQRSAIKNERLQEALSIRDIRDAKDSPIVRYVCKNVHQPRNCVTGKFMNPVKTWKIAGLPNPGEEVIKFKAWEPLGF